MIHSITARNVNGAFASAWHYLSAAGAEEQTRNGYAMVAPGPVVTTYLQPEERVLFNPKRDANGVFHLMEALWMLAGENSVEWLRQFSSNIATYAEADGTIHGAYGARWRNWFSDGEFDQLPRLIRLLRNDPTTRQAVLQMWDAPSDLTGAWRDRPCNTNIYFDVRGGRLNMTVCCRSNDILWGCYGANAVHMSVLQEFIARAVGVPVGEYRQWSNNWHAYTERPQVQHFLSLPPTDDYDFYSTRSVRPWPLLSAGERWEDFLEDCGALVCGGPTPQRTAFMRHVAVPLQDVYLDRAAGNRTSYKYIAECDWKVAFIEWCERRDNK
jgi:hypothetical protein